MRPGVALHPARAPGGRAGHARASCWRHTSATAASPSIPTLLAWWELAGTLRWGVICVMQAFSHLSGARRSVEHAVIGRRACEVEWDLLELLGVPLAGEVPGSSPVAPGGTSTTGDRGPADARTAWAPDQPAPRPCRPCTTGPPHVELLQASREALGDDVLPQLQGRAAFQLRVVLRALGIVGRELEHSAEHAALHAAALASVGCGDERELALAIRERRLQARDPRVLTAVRDTVRAKLEVANPTYLKQTEPAPEER